MLYVWWIIHYWIDGGWWSSYGHMYDARCPWCAYDDDAEVIA